MSASAIEWTDHTAAARFISAEPLLGPLVHDRFALAYPNVQVPTWDDGYDGPGLDLSEIDWLIVGGESGPRHRPIRIEWVRDLRDACLDEGQRHALELRSTARPAFFFKQWGGARPTSGGRELDGRAWDEFPVASSGAVSS